jgi:hypothetical protein
VGIDLGRRYREHHGRPAVLVMEAAAAHRELPTGREPNGRPWTSTARFPPKATLPRLPGTPARARCSTCCPAPAATTRRCWMQPRTGRSSSWTENKRGLAVMRALPGRAAVGPPGAASRLRVGQDQLTPAMVRQTGEIVGPQLDRFFGAQRRVVHAAEESHHPLTAFALLGDCGKQVPRLVAVDHGPRVHGLEGVRTSPLDRLERIRRQGTDLDRVLHEVVNDGPLPVRRVSGCRGFVLFAANRVEQRAAAGSAGPWAVEFSHRYGRGCQPARDVRQMADRGQAAAVSENRLLSPTVTPCWRRT